ncbi:twin-arginine translocase subunit TatC [Pelagicoccus sp. NFK12]|uniref:Sec-independent protein translocase protein TatC n=1 Tax=Pelagicoccus enzymogenes TaxID=2773457 RepID=A0A927F9A6_9BACT|nr:twin-arginine translocase subunit TatC [Pelagicoccus enzymogenes]MBD5779283.1 twin-arginine translocase subunit TatC [Pelagicoccus enzymogenes]MDQ8198365.1 twin-arginine translocase subunit TatC [Pelagicoccus enzymogenes]
MSDIVPKETEEEADEEDFDWADDPKKMGFLDHVEELRWTLIKPLAVFFIAFVVTVVFIQHFKDILMYPLYENYTLEQQKTFAGLATRNPTGVFTAMLHIGLLIGVTVASPVFLYYVGRFLAPALTKKEKKLLLPGTASAFFLFITGAAFAFFGLLPKAIQVTMAFNEMMGFQIIWSPDSYFGFITWIVLGMGVSFQFPLIAVVLVYLDIVTLEKLRSLRRVLIIIFFILAAVLTPPDPVTQIMMALPMIALYELSLIVAGVLLRKRAKQEEEEEYDD